MLSNAPSVPLLIFLTGFMGSGKSYTAKKLSTVSGIPCFDLDDLIEQEAQMSVAEIFATQGEEKFRTAEKQALEKFISEHRTAILSTGGGTPCFFDNARKLADSGVVIFLDTSVEVLAQRLAKETEKRPLLHGKNEEELKSFLKEKLGERLPYYEKAHVFVHQNDTEFDTANELQRVFAQLIGH